MTPYHPHRHPMKATITVTLTYDEAIALIRDLSTFWSDQEEESPSRQLSNALREATDYREW